MKEFLWSYLIHFSTNMWSDRPVSTKGTALPGEAVYRDSLHWDEAVWDEVVEHLAKTGYNTLIIDVGDGIVYESHPEIAVQNALSKAEFAKKLRRCRELGLKPVPKLNFSTCHDAWLKAYARMVSTPEYYKVVEDLITEVCELFDGPEYFHLGMDEETYGHQKTYDYIVIRNNELWWHDLFFMLNLCEKLNTRPWVWSDYYWNNPELFVKNMPRDVLQSNWYYSADFKRDASGSLPAPHVSCFEELERLGYDQVPTGSNWDCEENMGGLVKMSMEVIAPERLKGFMMAPWFFTHESKLGLLKRGADLLTEARAAHCGF